MNPTTDGTKILLFITLATLTLAACAGGGTEEPVVVETDAPATSRTPAPDTLLPEATGTESAPIEVAYFTPAQTEGPYYPVNKPSDRDNDLADLEGSSGPPAGDILEFGGTLFDAAGMPVAGALIEIWQTDNNGVYLHPRDPGASRRDANFQFYGESVTAGDGGYHFRTIVPGRYEPRPRHIHVKIKLNGQELLTTQFYFDNDPALASDSLFAGTTDDQRALIVHVAEGADTNGNPILLGKRDVVLRTHLSNP